MHAVNRYTISYILLWIFLAPSFVKIVHKHEPAFHCTAKNEKHFHVHHDHCLICAFHFSHFTQQHKHYKLFVKEVFRELIFLYKSVFVQKPYYLSLLLRGPPVDNDLVFDICSESLLNTNKS